MARQLLLIMAESEEAAEVVKAHTLGTWVDVVAPEIEDDLPVSEEVWRRYLKPAYFALRHRLIRRNLTPEPQPAHTEPSE